MLSKLLLCLVLLSCRLSATWTLVQEVTSNCSGNSSASITVTSTGSGNLLVVVFGMSVAQTLSSVTGGGTWVMCGANCRITQSGAGTTDAGYTLSSSSGATSITWTLSGNPSSCDVQFYEYSFTSGPASLDVVGTRAQTSSVTNPAGVTLSLTGTSDVIVQACVPSGSVSAIGSPYTQPGVQVGAGTASGFAGAINQSSGTAPTWTTDSSTDALVGLAFKEGTASTTTTIRRAIIL